jgi:peptidylprolyl isomerase
MALSALLGYRRHFGHGRCPRMKQLLPSSLAIAITLAAVAAPLATASTAPTTASVLAQTQAEDWRRPDPENLLYLDLAAGRVIIELNTTFAPRHAANIRTLVREGYFNGLPLLRVQDNYVVQWGDPDAADPQRARAFGSAERNLAPEFSVRLGAEQPFTRLPDGDVYAPEVGFLHGFAVARDPSRDEAWLAHCYGAVGVSRGNSADSGDGSSLYAVIGHSPRHLDRNITVVGRVLQGIEHLSSLPRGDGPLGFQAQAERYVPVERIRLAADVEATGQSPIEVMRTDTIAFVRLIEARRHRREEWFLHPTGRVELCNVPIPVRQANPAVDAASSTPEGDEEASEHLDDDAAGGDAPASP